MVDVSGKDGKCVGVAEASEAHERLLQDDGNVVGAAEASEAHERLLLDDGDVVGAAEASEAHEHIQEAAWSGKMYLARLLCL